MMATGDTAMQLLVQKLKQRFPEIPEHVVYSCVQQCSHDYQRCVEMLSQKSPQYMYGPFSELSINVKPEQDNFETNPKMYVNHQLSSRYPFHEGSSGSVSINRQNGNSSPVSARFSNQNPNLNYHPPYDPRHMANLRSASVSGMSPPVSSTSGYQSWTGASMLPKSAPVMPSKYEPFQSFECRTQGQLYGPPTSTAQMPITMQSGGVLPSYAQQGMYYGRCDYEMRVSYQAQVSNQRAQMERLHDRLMTDKQKLDLLKKEVASMEQQLSRRTKPTHSILSYEDIQKLKEETSQLRLECDTMSREVERLGDGKVPIGETSERFYENIYRGPSGPVGFPPPRPSRIAPAPPFPPMAQPSSSSSEEGHQWSCSTCTFLNNPALDKCEICEMPRIMLAAGYS